MPSLKGTRTEQNLKDAFAGESRANRRYLYLQPATPTLRASKISLRCCARRPSARPGARTAISTISRTWATRRPASRSVRPATSSRPHRQRDPTNISTCMRAWPALLARKASTASPTGSRRSPKPESGLSAASERCSTRFDPPTTRRRPRSEGNMDTRMDEKAGARSCTGPLMLA